VTILDRNTGVFTSTTSINVTRSTGSFGTGTVIVVMMFGNTTFSTPSGWTQRHNSVVNLGLYAYDRAGAGESSFAFTAGATGSGQWYVWELSAGSTYLTGALGQTGSAINYTTTAITPTAGNRHLFAVTGGTHASVALSVTGYSNSFTLGAGGIALAQDQPFSARAERDMTNDGVASVSTVGTFSNTTSGAAGGGMLAYVNNAGDVIAPTVPAGLTTTAIGSTTATLNWDASTDAVGVTGYEVLVVGP
jgi:hypothetical protein